jgi:hypothetical protein
MSTPPAKPAVRVGTPAALLAVVPYLFGFTPDSSLVVLSTDPQGNKITCSMRYDLPDPPGHAISADIAGHAIALLTRDHAATAVVIGYGPGTLVTPVIDAIRTAAARAGLPLHDMLRAEGGRYWSYTCTDPSCCPADGVPFDPAAHPVAAAMAAATGQPVLAGRAALEAVVTPVTGAAAEAMSSATRRAETIAAAVARSGGRRALDGHGLAAVQGAITTYRGGGAVTGSDRHAWLTLVLASIRVRDDAWARMDPPHCHAHLRLWTDLTRRAQPGYAAAPASLLAFTAWQAGNGALANIALDRALADTPGYSMALLLREALDAAVPPSLAKSPLTPDQLAEHYDGQYPSPAAGERPGSPGTTS